MGATFNVTAVMRMRCHVSVLLVALGLICATGKAAAADTADLILTNGRVFTGDPSKPWVEAVAIKGERIVAVGSASEVLAKLAPSKPSTWVGGYWSRESTTPMTMQAPSRSAWRHVRSARPWMTLR